MAGNILDVSLGERQREVDDEMKFGTIIIFLGISAGKTDLSRTRFLPHPSHFQRVEADCGVTCLAEYTVLTVLCLELDQ